MPPYFAHTNPSHPADPAFWERLITDSVDTGHLEKVSDLASGYAGEMIPPDEAALRDLAIVSARLLGLWHDLGKFSDEFQNYLSNSAASEDDSHTIESSGKVDHSTAGAQHAAQALPGIGILLAYAIAGHHAGLPDAIDQTRSCLQARLSKDVPDWAPSVPEPLLSIPPIPAKALPADLGSGKACPFSIAFFTRMIFSCLTDADFLATESFMAPERTSARPHVPLGIIDRMDRHLTDWLAQHFSTPTTSVQHARHKVLTACMEKAEQPPGLYSLTVPTGGGKTLSSLAFALRHAARHGLRRVIYAIPFTSIIEQNADVFRDVFADLGEEVVLEHHSNFDPDQETVNSRLASENWDAPLVVTTNVQLFESLFANRTSRCRKLHRIARSVIVLDEAQTLPVSLLAPCLRALRELVGHYGCTLVLCTATQPALVFRPGEFEIGLPQLTEIVPDPLALYANLKRVEVRHAGKLSLADLGNRLTETRQVLVIVNTRRHAADLYQALVAEAGDDGHYHLSAAMCSQHRSERLVEIRAHLRNDEPCRVVSTQLIEAGVDVDFPVVYRAIGGIDAIAQAAGRCNREGRSTLGVTWVFEPDETEHPIPRGHLRRTADAAREILSLHDDILALDAIEAYFRLHYWQHQDQWDKQEILASFNWGHRELPFLFDFATVAKRFQFIADTQKTVIVPWGETSQTLIEQLRFTHRMRLPPPAGIARRLQRYSVTIPQFEWKNALAWGIIELLHGRFAVLVSPELHYDQNTGLCLTRDGVYDPEQLIVA
ncbi:CRISPR-associated HD domain protein [Thiorhodococcus drewsii AZ1]|uniref:CRISPR-associated HD domain protein n=1 Tax=Thiorhodococcus drewsii AZ1 TaxID=765913 RepID=G2E5R6_9GAMM|nr:CRISPR-associated helicase/endonuclease Cas3 [Thiorhodococcus drewsii]EGV28561.1 CRISPR-associated HD domain protein [Thiorhodococcus drewsii AZ1]